MLTYWKRLAATSLAIIAGLAAAESVPLPAASRGELLYTTHCVTCHNEQVHWRDKREVSDWRSLRREVNRWQRMMDLGWGTTEVEDVARYLRQVHYRDLNMD